MIWQRAHRYYPPAVALADRHYSRQKPGTPQFMPAGSCLVLFAETDTGRAVWGTSAPQFAQHAHPGAWVCTMFRNEGAGKASKLIRQAVAATLSHYGAAPDAGMITFVDRDEVRPKQNPGWSFFIAGFRYCDDTAGGLITMKLEPSRMPKPEPALLTQASLFSGEAA